MSFHLECESCRCRFVALCDPATRPSELHDIPCPSCQAVVLVLPPEVLGEAEEVDLDL